MRQEKTLESIDVLLHERRLFPPPASFAAAHIKGQQEYERLYAESLSDPDGFWGRKAAIIWEGDDGSYRTLTYQQLSREVNRFANVLKKSGVTKGDRVTIYLPMIPELAISVLACARIGAIHSVVFGGFSPSSLRDRILDSDSRLVVTSDQGVRGGKPIPMKENCDAALAECPGIEKVIVVKRTGNPVPFVEDRDSWWHDEMDAPGITGICPPEEMDSEDALFILYTSGSTGKPKGVLHTTGGYMVYCALTFKWIFDYKEEDVYFCTADIGWVTGHSYILYGPLAVGATSLMFEGVPTWPNPGRFWEIIEKHGVNIFYTAPTAIRALMRCGTGWVEKRDLTSLRVLGSVGEPINPEAWMWYHSVVGKSKLPVVDTWWQTETGGILRGTYGDPENRRIKEIYFSRFPGFYMSGDGARVDEDGDFWLMGRIDDVLNVSGHRLGTAEIESALVSDEAVAEAAVVGYPHSVKGEGIYAFVVLKEGVNPTPELTRHVEEHVKNEISPIAKPDKIHFAAALPKTRSGKIMRRILRKIAQGSTEDLGDTSTLADPTVVETLVKEKL